MRQENNTGCSVYQKVFNSNVNVKKSAKLCGGGVTRVGGGTWWVLLARLFQQQRGVTWGQISQHVACVVPPAHLDDLHL